MVEQKAKSASEKVAALKAKPKTNTAVSGKTKTAIAALATTAKKVTAKKTVAAVAELTKTKPPAKKAAAAKVKPSAAAKKTVANPSPEERYRMVQTAAYFIAEQYGFEGHSDEHWAVAEREIAEKLDQ